MKKPRLLGALLAKIKETYLARYLFLFLTTLFLFGRHLRHPLKLRAEHTTGVAN
ncbi:MAG: hypothetical protein UW65_C0011G0007 [candidate division WWE3 bacterium GW2011_GWB1_44_4]|uniref:Uncharacterized protein n=2 Tax=Katanobacteria TaxID=422282 RepID=A0A0G1KLW3_UNCKA|nr:MAG: hypothetical protein UW65_C0011G0007 [candidate division WWE3 bacterium GW2011_GWB1_44_4]KKT84651.1 MAG: hypothetical protein UW82_C0014G0003 [candidate division WWE3 bacterium GW2011_GWC2_44_9]